MNNIYFWLTPFTILLLVSELEAAKLLNKQVHTFQDSMASLNTAIVNQIVNLAVAALVYVCYGYLWDNWRLFTIEDSLLSFILLIIGIDFLFYWFHRLGHSVNILWAAHMPHHTSEEMNLLVGLRASVTQRIFSFSFFWPLCLLGYHPTTIYLATGVQLFLGYWHHTRLIERMPYFEAIFNSPSYHRVHHGVNQKYLDKNFGEVFIIWDKLFGTCVEEDPAEEVVYGVFNHPKSWDPVDINFAYYRVLWRDFLAADTYWDKLRIWFMPLGWRPRNLPKRNPLPDVKMGTHSKFTSPMDPALVPYIVLKSVLGLLLMYYAIDKNTSFGTFEKIASFGLILHSTINSAGMMSRSRWFMKSEGLHIGLAVLFFIFSFTQYQ